MEPSPVRARRSLYSAPPRRRRPLVALALALIVIVVAGCGVVKVTGFMNGVLGVGNPIAQTQSLIQIQPGSIAYKLSHGQQVNLLLLGYGGAENDAPWLTDTIMAVSLDPATHRVAEISIPRDLMVPIDAFKSGDPLSQKINVAYSIGVDDADWSGKRSEFIGRDAGGKLSEQAVSRVTGLQFDRYVAVDFKAFRDVVDALGGIPVCLDTALDDNQYPDYHNGYIKGGIHFPAGCQSVNGEKALQLARSRHAVEPEQMNDYGRSRRQQLIINSIRRKVVTVNGLTKAPQLMGALEKNFRTDLDLGDLRALYDWAGKLPDTSVIRVGLTEQDLVDRFYMRPGSCGAWYADVLCVQDPSYRTLKSYLAAVFVDPRVVAEKAPVEVDNASVSSEELGDRVTRSLQPLGFQLGQPVRRPTLQKSVIYDYSGGRYPLTAEWLSTYFGATVVAGSPAAAGSGLVVELGRDYALRWIGKA